MTLYLDNNASTPLDPRVRDEMVRCLDQCVGNAGSPHRLGLEAKQQVHRARDQIGRCVGARRHEVIFTSGATESNNLALIGLAVHGTETGRRHIVTTSIEHKAVLEPLQALAARGFEVTYIAPRSSGQVAADDVLHAVRNDTLLVSVMHVNNETGICQPIETIADGLTDRSAYLHVDAAQGFGKANQPLKHPRIDLLSLSGHKVYGPQGIGALVARRRDGQLPPLAPLMHGGGQEFGLRPGTLPVVLIAGFGLAAELADREWLQRAEHCRRLREVLVDRLQALRPVVHGQTDLALPHVVNLSFPGWHAEEAIEALSHVAAISDGAACTSVCATTSHVLSAMQVPSESIDGAVRISWSHLTELAAMEQAADAMQKILGRPQHEPRPAG